MGDSGDNYTAKDIMVLSGPEGIRKRPAMYIGSTGSKGYMHLLHEVIDNAIDEALAGYAKNITIRLTREGDADVAEVSDDGRGIPIDIIPKEGRPALEVIMTSLHSGAKFNSNVYKVAGGLHGVGLTVVDSLSEYTDVTVKRGGKIYSQKFSRGKPVTGLTIIGETDPKDTGTIIRFKPDSEIFSARSFDSLELQETLTDQSFLNPGIKITLMDERDGEKKTQMFYSERGMADFINYIIDSKEPLTKPIFISKTVDSTKIDVALQYVNDYSENVVSFVNRIKTTDGGMHVAGFHAALTRAIMGYIEENRKKGTSANVEGDDTREGLTAIISVLMQNPEFEGQTKERLGNNYIKSIVDNAVYGALTTYLEENPSDANVIVSKITAAAEARESARKARELARKKSIFGGALLPGKLSDCSESDPAKAEIFIVEGESAAGSSKQARDRKYQAILPLRGKILNVEKATDEKIFNNAELHTMVTAFGTGIKETFNPDNLRYGKVIMLTDADVDGSHIRTLLLTFFYRYMRPLIERGNIYIAQPPLYRVSKGREEVYAYSDSELQEKLKLYDNASVQRYKGLGEMNPEQLWSTTMDPEKRVLKRVTIKDAQLADALFTILMGLDVGQRRHFLEEHSTEVSFLDI
ncbi:MAG: DNA gyrase/topoisomerase IV subunit B [Candidatus Micrarchaeia archaeon]